MANKIVLKKSSVPEKVPQTTDLEYGELALNYSDGKLFYKTSSNTIDYFQSSFDVDSFKTISVDNQQSLVAAGPNSVLTFVAGNGITITTNAKNSSIQISSQVLPSDAVANIEGRTQTISVFLTPMQQIYLQYDGDSSRNNTAVVEARSGVINVLV
jgi:hypothetical protein